MSGGSTSTNDTTTNQINQIPQWMSDAGQQNYAYAQNVAQQPLQQYQGQMVADVAPQTQQAWDVAANSGNVGADQYNAASAGYLNAMNQSPMMNTAAQSGLSQTGSSNLSQYMNPYTQSVINATLPIMQQQLGLSQDAQQNAASSANAYGGSRQGIQQGVTQAQGAMNMAQMAAQLNSANYNQARQASEFDVGAANNMGQFNATAQNTVAGQNQLAQQAGVNSGIQAAYGLTNTGQSMNAANAANYNLLQSAGAGQSMQAQNQINAQMAKFNQAFNYPQQQLGTLLSSLGMTPHDTSSSGQSNTTTTTPTDWASLIKGGGDAASSVLGMFGAGSDKEMKTDITKLGKDPKTGLQMHAYRYKGDPKTYPKVVGPMAQEVQEKYPDQAKRVGGKLTVSPDMMSAAGVKGYAAGTPFVGQPPLTPFLPPSSPGVAKAISSMSAFVPKVRLPRGAGVPKMQKFAYGTSDVQAPDLPDDAFDGSGGPGGFLGILGKGAAGASKVGGDLSGGAKKAAGGGSQDQQGMQPGQPSMGYLISGYAAGTPNVGSDLPSPMEAGYAEDQAIPNPNFLPDRFNAARPPAPPPGMVPQDAQNMFLRQQAYSNAVNRQSQQDRAWDEGGRQKGKAPVYNYPSMSLAGGIAAVPGQGMGDTVPSMLTPGEAVLTPRAAQHVGRGNIAALNAMLPPVSSRTTAAPRAGARGIAGALANTKRRPGIAGGLSG